MKFPVYEGNGNRQPDELLRILPISPGFRLLKPENYIADSGLKDACNVALSDRWIERNPPPSEQINVMLDSLEKYLGKDSFYWLSACAVFPELHWNITIYLGNVLKTESGESLLYVCLFTDLARLPWLRYGYIPDWLRAYLITTLTSEQQQRIRTALQDLLITAVQGSISKLQLQIAIHYHTFLPKLADTILYLLSKKAAVDSPLRDYIFLGFMAGQSALAMKVSDEFSRSRQVQPQPPRTPILRQQAVKSLLSRISLKSTVFAETVIQLKILLPNKLLVCGAGAILLLGLGGYLYWGQSLPLTGHSGEVNSLAVNSNSLSHNFASGSDDKTVKIWNIESGDEIRTLTGHSDWVYAVAISPDGKTVVSGSKDKTIKVWNLNTGKESRTLNGHKDFVNSVAISPDGETIVSGSYDKTIKVWNLNTGKEIRTITGHLGAVLSVAISPDGKTIVSGSKDKTIKVWNLNTGKEIRTITGHLGDVNDVVISQDGQMLASASDDKTIKVWKLDTGTEIRTITGHLADVNAIAFSPNGEYIASGSDDKTVKVWQLNTGELIHTFNGHSAEVYAIAFSADGKTLVSGGKDKTIKIWQLP